MRLEARMKLGYYPLPETEALHLRQFLKYPSSEASLLDPCAGTGDALIKISKDANVRRYAIELDVYRANEARTRVEEVIQGNAFDCHAPVESFSLLYLNPPYDFEVSEGKNQRMERLFLEHCYRWLKPGGVLILVTPFDQICPCRSLLASQFREPVIYRLTAAESIRYKQAVLFGIRRTRQERDRLTDQTIQQTQQELWMQTRRYDGIPALTNTPDHYYSIPPSPAAKIEHRGLPLDCIEDFLPQSSASRQARKITQAEQTEFTGRPLTPLHSGHVGLLCTSGLLNGIFGEGEDRHVAYWETVKRMDHQEEEDENGRTVVRERDRFSQRLTLLYRNGRVALLSGHGNEEEGHNGERTPSNGHTDVHSPDQGQQHASDSASELLCSGSFSSTQ